MPIRAYIPRSGMTSNVIKICIDGHKGHLCPLGMASEMLDRPAARESNENLYINLIYALWAFPRSRSIAIDPLGDSK